MLHCSLRLIGGQNASAIPSHWRRGVEPFRRSGFAVRLAAEKDTLVVAIGDTINSLDIQRAGTNRPA